MLESIIRNASALVFLFLFCFTFTGIGLLIWKRMRLSASHGETLFFSFGIGASVTGYAVFALAAVQLLYPAFLFSLLVLLLALATAGWYNSGLFTMQHVNLPRGVVEQLAAGVLVIVLGAALLLTLTPETGRDALLYHLAIPKLYLKHHGFYFVPGNVFANYPFHTELLYLLALFLDGDILAKLFNFAMLPVILLGIYQFAIRQMTTNSFPFLSMLIFVMIPSVFVDSHMAYNDLATTLYSLSGFFAFIIWNERKEQGWLILFAFFTGMVLANKYTTLIIPFIGCLGVLWGHRSNEKGIEAMRDFSIYASITLVCGAPFYLKNWLLTGNPFYPFLYGLFGGIGWDPEQARLFDGITLYMGMGRRFIDYLLLPWNLSIHARIDSIIFDGVIGPLFLIVLPFLIFIKKKDTSTKLILVYSLFFFLFWASASQQIRYLFPIFPFLACLAGSVLTHFRRNRWMTLILGSSVGACLLFNANQMAKDFMRVNPVPLVFGMESRDAFLTRSLSAYPMYRYLNSNLPPNSKIYLIYMKNWTFLCDRECYADSMFEHYTLKKILSSSSSPDDVYRRLKGMGFTHLMYNEPYVIGEKSMLSREEKELFASFQKKFLTPVSNDRSYFLYRMPDYP